MLITSVRDRILDNSLRIDWLNKGKQHMPWDEDDYPDSMKNLDKQVRDKAIEIANALLEDGYEEGRAISIGIAQAKKWADEHDKD